MKLAEFGRRAFPVTDVGFVPDFPIPGVNFRAAVFFGAMFGPLIDEFGPFCVILRRVGPAGVDFVVAEFGIPLMLIRVGLDRKVLRHETNLDVWTNAALEVSVEYVVENFPIVDGLAVGVFRVGAGGTPFERGCAVAGGEEIVCAKINGLWRERAEFVDEFRAVFHVGVVGLVGAEESPDRFEVTLRG